MSDTYRREIREVLSTDWWQENAIFDFLCAYRIKYKDGPTQTAVVETRLAPRDKTLFFLRKLMADGWVDTRESNGKLRFLAKWVE